MENYTLLLLLAAQGCSGGGNNGDGGLPDGTDAGNGDGYVVECSQEDVYCIVIEAGARFSQFMYMTSWLGVDPNDYEKLQVYDSCDYTHYTLYIITAEAQSGDRVVFDKRMYSPDIVGGSMPANLESAQATVAGTTRSADDYFSLVYSAVHHNWDEGYTVLLRPPIGDVHGLVLIDAGSNDDPVEMLYLGSDLTQIRVSPLTSYSEVKQ